MVTRNRVAAAVAAGTAVALGVALARLPAPAPAPPPSVPVAAAPYAQGVLPDPLKTPGAVNRAVTDATINATIGVSGWTSTIRPPASYTTGLKKRQLAAGYAINGDMALSDYEEDHLVSLEIGGNPTDERNLWPALWHLNSGGYDLGMKTKDALENRLKELVVTGKMPLAQAQHEIETDWPASYKVHVGPWPPYRGPK
jgi:hypothetical protein